MEKIITFPFNTKRISMSFLLFGLLLMLTGCGDGGGAQCPPFGC